MKENLGYTIFLATVAAIGGFLFGYDTAVISGTIKSVTAQFSLTELQAGWYVGCALLGSIAGAVSAGWLSDKLGRKPTLLFSAVLFAVSAAGCMLAWDITSLETFRMIGGIGIGTASIVSPLYISETSIAKYRGRMVTMYQLAVTIGFLGAYLINYLILQNSANVTGDGLWAAIWGSENWRGMLGAGTLPALLFFITILFIPESPRFLIIKGKETKAVKTLSRIYSSTGVEKELEELKRVISSEVKSDWRLLLQPAVRSMVLVGVAIAMLGQFMGINAVLYYGPSIFEQTGLAAGDSLFYQIIVGAINVLGTILGMWLIDRIGRKKLVYWGVSGMMSALLLIGLYFMTAESLALSPVVLLALILIYVFSAAVSICVVIWVLLSEMYPTRVRGMAMSIAGLSLWIGTYLIGQLTPWLITNMSPALVFWLFGIMCVPYILLIWKKVPETTGKTLEEIEEKLK